MTSRAVIVHRYEIPVQDAVEALLGGAVGDCEGWRVRVEGDTVVVDIIEPAGKPADADPQALEAPAAPKVEQPAAAPAQPERKGGELAKKAGMLCNEGGFRAFIDVATPDAAKAYIYRVCGVGSRVDLDYEEEPAKKFRDIVRGYEAWLSAPE